MAKRDWLVGAYRQRISDANEMISNLANADDRELLNAKFGGLLSDPHFVNKQGRFRSIASKLNKVELQKMIDILDDFLSHEHHIYEEGEKLKELARRLGAKEEYANRILALMEYAQAKVKEGVLSSNQILDIVKDKVQNQGKSVSQVINELEKAIDDSKSDPEMLFTLFSESGRYV